MTAAEFIDLILTPILCGVGAFFGMRLVARRGYSAAGAQTLPRWTAPLVGILVCLMLFATKMAKA